MVWAIIGIILFALFLYLGTKFPLIAIFLMAMGVWGVYYEFFGFASHQFVADTVPFKFHAASWAFLGIFKNLAYFLGPMLASLLILKGSGVPAFGAIILALTGGAVLLASGKTQNRPVEVDFKEVNLIKEMEHWFTLARYVWPMVVMSLFLGLIDSVFWTTGAIWTEELARESFWGSLLIPAYQLPSLFIGMTAGRWKIYEGKKRLAIKFMLLAGILLAGLGLVKTVPLIVFLIFASSAMLAITYPMADAVYSDIIARLGRKRSHLIGLTGSTINLAYIVGPIMGGFLAEAFGERLTFSLLGVITVLVALILLVFIPRKLRLPQTKIQTWGK
jgi:hypothetical protein